MLSKMKDTDSITYHRASPAGPGRVCWGDEIVGGAQARNAHRAARPGHRHFLYVGCLRGEGKT